MFYEPGNQMPKRLQESPVVFERTPHRTAGHSQTAAGNDLPQLAHTPAGRIHKPHAKAHGLLVLDGRHLVPEISEAALKSCYRMVDRLDILLVDPPKAPTSLLHELLIKLEQNGIDYRLTSAYGNLEDLVASYLRRFLGITMVIADTSSTMGRNWHMKIAELDRLGYRFMPLAGLKMAA